MKTPRELARWHAHQVVADECCHNDTLGWSHGWRCEAITETFTQAFKARDAEHASQVARLREALGVAAASLDRLVGDDGSMYAEHAGARGTFFRCELCHSAAQSSPEAIVHADVCEGSEGQRALSQLRPLLDGGKEP